MNKLFIYVGAFLFAHPHIVILLLCVGQGALWVLAAIPTTSPALDSAEMMAWGQEWQWGYYKHPPLPAWFAEISYQLGGGVILGPVIASQLLIIVNYIFVYLLGRLFFSPPQAVLGTFFLLGIVYFSWPTAELNHNIAVIPCWTAILYFFALVWQKPDRLFAWLLMGVSIGIAVYAKYSIGILLLVLTLWILFDRHLRYSLLRPYLWFGASVAFLIVLPHLIWLWQWDFLPLEYAQARSLAKAGIWNPVKFLLAQLANHLPLLLLLAILGHVKVILPLRFARLKVVTEDRAVLFFTITTLAPVFGLVLLALFTNSGLKDMWGAPMFSTSGLLVIALLQKKLTVEYCGKMLIGCVFFLVLSSGLFGIKAVVQQNFDFKPSRNIWPMAELVEKTETVWRKSCNKPMRIIGGNLWLSQLFSAGSRDRPSVIIGNEGQFSPWISLNKSPCGKILLLYFSPLKKDDWFDGMKPLVAGDFDIHWPNKRKKKIYYYIID